MVFFIHAVSLLRSGKILKEKGECGYGVVGFYIVMERDYVLTIKGGSLYVLGF